MIAPSSHIPKLLVALVVLAVAGGGAVLDANARRSAPRDQALEATRALGFPDLALSSSARWLRVPTQSERTSPLHDAPIAFDTDPAGGVLGPTLP